MFYFQAHVKFSGKIQFKRSFTFWNCDLKVVLNVALMSYKGCTMDPNQWLKLQTTDQLIMKSNWKNTENQIDMYQLVTKWLSSKKVPHYQDQHCEFVMYLNLVLMILFKIISNVGIAVGLNVDIIVGIPVGAIVGYKPGIVIEFIVGILIGIILEMVVFMRQKYLL